MLKSIMIWLKNQMYRSGIRKNITFCPHESGLMDFYCHQTSPAGRAGWWQFFI